MSSQIEVIAILSPKPGSIEQASLPYHSLHPDPTVINASIDSKCIQCIEALAPLGKHVEENEPGALRYELYRQVNVETGNEDLVVIELYGSCIPSSINDFRR